MDFGTFDANDSSSLADLFIEKGSPVSHRKIGGWAVAILPYIDQQAIYEHWTDDRFPIVFSADSKSSASSTQYISIAAANISTYQCPSDPGRLGSTASFSSYACNAGMYHDSPVGGVSFAQSMSAANGVFNNKFPGLDQNGNPVATGPDVSLDDFKDGLSHTLLFSENINAQSWHRAGLANADDLVIPADGSEIRYPIASRYAQGLVWHYEDDKGAGGAPKVAAIHRINGAASNKLMTIANASDLARPSSFHEGGVNAVFADGSTRFLSETIDYKIYQALLTPRGKQSDTPNPAFVIPTDALD